MTTHPAQPIKRPEIITVAGILAILGAAGEALSLVPLLFLLSGYSPAQATILSYFFVVHVPFAILFLFEGIGLLQMRKWLPPLLYISYAIGLVLIVWGTFFTTSLSVEGVLIALVVLALGGWFVGYIYSKRALFIH